MCIICVEIMRERLTMKDAKQQIVELRMLDAPVDKHLIDIIEADNNGDTKRVAELVKAGYKKERWI